MGLREDLAKAIDGGLQENGIYLVVGAPGSGKSAFCVTLMDELLRDGEDCAFITTDLAPVDLKWHAEHGFGMDFARYEQGGQLEIMDGCSWKAEGGCPGAIDLSDLPSLGHRLSGMLEEAKSGKRKKFFLFFDTVSSLLLYNDAKSLMKFLQTQVLRLRSAGVPAILTLEEDAADRAFADTLSAFVDGVFSLQVKCTDHSFARSFRVSSMRSSPHHDGWQPSVVGNCGYKLTETLLWGKY